MSLLISWNANPASDNVTAYLLYRATGLGAAFAAAALIWTGQALNYVDATAVTGTAYTYFLEAQNQIGVSVPTAGLSITALSQATYAASETIAAGAFVNIWNNGGQLNIRNADQTNPSKSAQGFIAAALTTGQSGIVYAPGQVNSNLSGLTPGLAYFLGMTGGVTTTIPSTAGYIVQQVGKALTSTSLIFQPYGAITI